MLNTGFVGLTQQQKLKTRNLINWLRDKRSAVRIPPIVFNISLGPTISLRESKFIIYEMMAKAFLLRSIFLVFDMT